MDYKEEALKMHKEKQGKIEVTSKVKVDNKDALSIAYTPGVAQPCLEIAKDKSKVYDYTAKGNMVAILTDGSAVLGLGNIGPEASLPVMEGKAVLFKEFGGVDAFPICVDTQDTEEIIDIAKKIAPGFGGINLEDISAPRCFEVEERLKKELDIPVFHDDQHGTAIVTLAGLINALKIVDKKMEDLKVVFNGAGAAGIAVAKIFKNAGVKSIVMCDSKGVIYNGRDAGMNKYKEEFMIDTEDRTLADGMKGADVFVGVSVKDAVTQDMVKSMNESAIIFAMANPDPEILPSDALEAGAAVIATGRSDFPNQINNVLAFPNLFRGALDAQAKQITEEMKVVAAEALAAAVENPTADKIIPEPFDKGYGEKIAEAVKKVAENDQGNNI